MEAHNTMIRAKANIWLLETVWASEEELHPGRPGLSPGEGLERQAGPRAGPAKGRAVKPLGWEVLKLPASVVVRGPSPHICGGVHPGRKPMLPLQHPECPQRVKLLVPRIHSNGTKKNPTA